MRSARSRDCIVDIRDRFADDGVVVVVDERGVILGVVRSEVRGLPGGTSVADVATFEPPSVRPSITASELAKSMKKDGRSYVLVSLLDGVLEGIIRREDLHGQH